MSLGDNFWQTFRWKFQFWVSTLINDFCQQLLFEWNPLDLHASLVENVFGFLLNQVLVLLVTLLPEKWDDIVFDIFLHNITDI